MNPSDTKTQTIFAAAALVTLLLLGGVVVLFSARNDCVRQEAGVLAVYRDAQVQYDTFWKKVKETAQVTDAYRDDFKAVFLGSMQSRYEGKDPALSFIHEANPALPPDMYASLQRVIEGGRSDFAQTQRTLVDRQRAYSTTLQSWPSGALAGWLGFPQEVNGDLRPSKDRDGDGRYTVLDYDTVTSTTTQAVFQSGHEEAPLQVFGE